MVIDMLPGVVFDVESIMVAAAESAVPASYTADVPAGGLLFGVFASVVCDAKIGIVAGTSVNVLAVVTIDLEFDMTAPWEAAIIFRRASFSR